MLVTSDFSFTDKTGHLLYYYIWGGILFMCEYVHNAPAGQEGALDPLMLGFTGIYDLPKVGDGN